MKLFSSSQLLKSAVVVLCHSACCMSLVIPIGHGKSGTFYGPSNSKSKIPNKSNLNAIRAPSRASYQSTFYPTDDNSKHIDRELYEKAKRFGLSKSERFRIDAILQRLQVYASQLHSSASSTSNHSSVISYSPPESRWPLRASQYHHSRREQAIRQEEKPSGKQYFQKRNVKQVPGRFLDSDHDLSHSPEERGEYFEGDIVLWEHQAESIADTVLHGDERRKKRKFIAALARRWDPEDNIEYSFDGSHSKREQKIIELAMEHWQNITCLNFAKMTDKPTGNRIVFTDVDGCASNVGRHPLGEPQFVSIAPECLRLGVIAHEVAHALGFWHEQSRPDRDLYVDVVWNNIDKMSKGQFLKEQPDDVDSAHVPYDYGSIMHYRSKAFSKVDDLFTIHTNVQDYQKTIGQRDQLSFNDIRLMNKIYCSSTCPQKLDCLRGGYTDPRRCERCRCPDGFTGKLCDEVMTGYGASCGGEIQVGNSWMNIQSPNYPSEFKEGQECSWLFKAPPGHHVEYQFIGDFDLYCKSKHSLCMDYVEIRNTTDFANTGMRYCCYSTPQGSVFSRTEDMLVLFRSFYKSGKGFKGRARSVQASGSWSGWGDWSICTGSCGACGTQQRKRTCALGTICHGDDTETRVCNENPCDLCPETRYVSAPCGGFLGLLRGIRCKVERTVYAPCRDNCCNGYQVRDGVCVP